MQSIQIRVLVFHKLTIKFEYLKYVINISKMNNSKYQIVNKEKSYLGIKKHIFS